MKYLLDTHVMLWWLRDNPKLGPRTRSVISQPEARLLVSVASFWELSIKLRSGKFDESGLDESGLALLDEATSQGLEVIGIEGSHLRALEALPRHADHSDPFDHVILAQAISENAMLVTSDQRMLRYDISTLQGR